MNQSEVQPRVNSSYLPKSVNRMVRVVGKVLAINSSTNEALLESSDQGQVVVQMMPGSSLIGCNGRIVEVLGRVQQNLAVAEVSSTGFNDTWDPNAYNKMVLTTWEFKDVFGW